VLACLLACLIACRIACRIACFRDYGQFAAGMAHAKVGQWVCKHGVGGLTQAQVPWRFASFSIGAALA